MVQGGGRRSPLRRQSAIALVLALIVTLGAAWAARTAVRDQEKRLLKERTGEIGLLLTQSINSIPTSLAQQGAILRATHGSASAYMSAANEALQAPGTAPSTTYAWVHPVDGGAEFVVTSAAGPGLSVGQVINDARAATLRRALTTKEMVPTPVIGSERILGFALGPPAAPPGTVLYRESRLGPTVSPPRAAGSAPFSDLDIVLYSGATNKTPVLVSTSKQMPLPSLSQQQLLDAGVAKWLLVARARQPLVGSLTYRTPWMVLIAGLLGSLLIAIAVESAARRRDAAIKLYESEHDVAETLQRNLLPVLPELPGVDLAARYLAGGAGQSVGGDWFDVFPVAGDRIALVVGDVIGHDVSAASAMAQIRAALRAYAVDGAPPADVLNRLDRLVSALHLTQLVTVFYGLLDAPDADGNRVLHYANAGHIPPLLRRGDGEIVTLTGGQSVVIGAPIELPHQQTEHPIEQGEALVLFTDGLVEVPGGSLDESLHRLAQTLAQHGDGDAEQMCEHVLTGVSLSDLRDDIALLAVRLTPTTSATAVAKTETIVSRDA